MDGQLCWVISSEKYIKASLANVEQKLQESGQRLPSRCYTPFSHGYRAETDESGELKADGVQYYQELVGILRWAIELGRIDILTEVSMLSTYLAMPREGHLQQALHVFGYLKNNQKRSLAMDPRSPNISENRFVEHDWYDF